MKTWEKLVPFYNIGNHLISESPSLKKAAAYTAYSIGFLLAEFYLMGALGTKSLNPVKISETFIQRFHEKQDYAYDLKKILPVAADEDGNGILDQNEMKKRDKFLAKVKTENTSLSDLEIMLRDYQSLKL